MESGIATPMYKFNTPQNKLPKVLVTSLHSSAYLSISTIYFDLPKETTSLFRSHSQEVDILLYYSHSLCSGMLLNAFQDMAANMKIEWILSCLKKGEKHK